MLEERSCTKIIADQRCTYIFAASLTASSNFKSANYRAIELRNECKVEQNGSYFQFLYFSLGCLLGFANSNTIVTLEENARTLISPVFTVIHLRKWHRMVRHRTIVVRHSRTKPKE